MSTLLSYALTNVADVKETMGIASSDHSWDNLIIRKINQVTKQIEAYCGRRFLLTTYTDEVYNSTNSNQLILRQRPVVGSVALSVRDTPLNESDFETVESTLVYTDANSGVLDLNFQAIGSWGRYMVTYSAGYATIPEDLAEAAATLASYYALNPDGSTVGINEKQEGQRRVKYSDNNSVTFDSIMSQLGVDQIINSYSNNPVLLDR